MGCCECFGFAFATKPKKVVRPSRGLPNNTSQEFLLDEETGDEEDDSYDGDMTDMGNGGESEFQSPTKRSEEILMHRMQRGLVCREFPVKETHIVLHSEVSCSTDILILFLTGTCK